MIVNLTRIKEGNNVYVWEVEMPDKTVRYIGGKKWLSGPRQKVISILENEFGVPSNQVLFCQKEKNRK